MPSKKAIRTKTDSEALSQEEAILRRYFDDIVDSKPLPREREEELATRIKEGDVEARDELVRANLRFVIDVARGFQNRGLSLSELISAGNMGLITAAERFDGERGFTQSPTRPRHRHLRTRRLTLQNHRSCRSS